MENQSPTKDATQPQQTWAIVEVMGHQVYAGQVSQDTSLGVPLLRVEVPSTKDTKAFTKLLAAGSIFSVTPCDEAAARTAAERFASRPFTIVSLSDYGRQPKLLGAPEAWDGEDDDDNYSHPALD